MREAKKIRQDVMGYSLCKLLLDYLYFKGLIDSLTVHQDGKVEFTFLDGSVMKIDE